MKARTHLAGGAVAGLAFVEVASKGQFGIELSLKATALCFVLALLGSLAPDIDLQNSKAGQFAKPAGFVLHRVLGHRTLFHSPLVMICIYLAQVMLYPQGMVYCIAFLTGYGSHIFLDMLNKAGVPLLYPNTKRFSLIGIRSGSMGETIIYLSLCAVVFVKLYAMLEQFLSI